MKQTDGILVLSDQPLLGAGAFVEQHKSESERALAEALREHALEHGVGLPAARGPIDAFESIVRRIRGRTLMKDLGEHEVAITWLTAHAPPGGNTHLRVAQLAKSGFGVQLSVLGIGLGSGRSVTLGVDRDFGKRDKCMRIQHKFRVAIRAYRYDEDDDAPKVQTDVVKQLGEKISSYDDCPYCFLEAEHCPDMAEAIEENTCDLTDDPTGKSEKTSITIENEKEIELGLKLPLGGLEITPSLAVKRNWKLICSLESHFPGGYCYTPHRIVGEWNDLPFWGRS